eukprot:TRINITY_DN103341_c0_g1_i1.p3 TRINITY_DN103341_c0_g1~~TRINITY_DN103341_c0_g1_i1.p3  ORF type:complete len:145 (-),score=10.43 TRINITY_DN103341_c0_g1_i1:30-464(-)
MRMSENTPNSDIHILPSGHHERSTGAEVNVAYETTVASKLCDWFATVNSPNHNTAITTTSTDKVAIWGEANTFQGALSLQPMHDQFRFQVPYPHCHISAATGYEFVVESDVSNCIGVSLQFVLQSCDDLVGCLINAYPPNFEYV